MTAHVELIARLEAAATALSDRVYAEMIADPFWLERYPERASTNLRRDSGFHLQYLREALATDHPDVLENYARWLQQLLVARGMCTEHIVENFERLSRAIADQGWLDAVPAVALLAAGVAALRYPPGPAADLQCESDAIAAGDREVRHLVSYLADALAQDSPDRFVEHVAWLGGSGDRRGIPRDRLRGRLATLGAAIADHAPAAHARAGALLAAATAVL